MNRRAFLTGGAAAAASVAVPAALPNLIQVRTRKDYYQIEWPWRSRKYEYGVYADEVLQHHFPPSDVTNLAERYTPGITRIMADWDISGILRDWNREMLYGPGNAPELMEVLAGRPKDMP